MEQRGRLVSAMQHQEGWSNTIPGRARTQASTIGTRQVRLGLRRCGRQGGTGLAALPQLIAESVVIG